MRSVAAFTDTYLPTINGVTYTIRLWRERWEQRGGRMDVVYPGAGTYTSESGERPVWSLPFPFYDGFRLGIPRVPRAVHDVDVVHIHSPFPVGWAGLRLARKENLPVVASYHTPTREYTEYLVSKERFVRGLRRVSEAWERVFYRHADMIIAPSKWTEQHIRNHVGITSPVHVIPTGVDTDLFKPVDPTPFMESHDLPMNKPLIGYTGRHGYEKRLNELIDAAATLGVAVVFGGDGPARSDLERRAESKGVDVRFLGFLARDDLPFFYSSIDVFAFPSPVETQGIVALEAMACGTPVVGANSGALSEVIRDGETGYHYSTGDITGFRDAIVQTLDENEELRDECLSRRNTLSVERTIDELIELYGSL